MDSWTASGSIWYRHLQRAAWERGKSLARRVTDAFVACEESFQAQLESFLYVIPWTTLDVEQTSATTRGGS